MSATRWFRHLFAPSASARFPEAALARIGEAIAAGERLHDGEIVFAVEAGLPWTALVAGTAPRDRAHEVFARLRVWDTAANNGVLLYLLLADHSIELVADRGFRDRVGDGEWEAVCAAIEAGLAGGDPAQAVVDGIARLSALVAMHFPAASGGGGDEPASSKMVASDVVALGVFVKVDVGGGERARGRGHAEGDADDQHRVRAASRCGMWDQL